MANQHRCRKLSDSAAGDSCMICGDRPAEYGYFDAASGELGLEVCQECKNKRERDK